MNVHHISSALGSIERSCPVCHANPYQPCRSLIEPSKVLRYTHAERNR